MKKYILPAILPAVGAGIAAASFAAKTGDCCKAAKSCCEVKSDCCKTAAAADTKDCCQAVQICCETEADCCGIVNDAELTEP